MLKDTKRITGTSRKRLGDYPKTFFQKEAMNLYRNDPEFKELFNNEVKDALKTEYLDVYESKDASDVDL